MPLLNKVHAKKLQTACKQKQKYACEIQKQACVNQKSDFEHLKCAQKNQNCAFKNEKCACQFFLLFLRNTESTLQHACACIDKFNMILVKINCLQKIEFCSRKKKKHP